MPITRNTFLKLIRLAVIHSEPAGSQPAMESFCVLNDLAKLDGDIIPQSENELYFWSNEWAIQGKVMQNQSFDFPILCVQPISEAMEQIGKYNIDRKTTYRLYFLDQLEKANPGQLPVSSHDLQEAMSVHASRVFRLLSTVVYASTDGSEYSATFEPLLEAFLDAGTITTYEIDKLTTKNLRKGLSEVTGTARGGYVDGYTKHNLFGTVYEFELLECMQDEFSLLENKLCC